MRGADGSCAVRRIPAKSNESEDVLMELMGWLLNLWSTKRDRAAGAKLHVYLLGEAIQLEDKKGTF